jgi:hypothetical protein
MISMVNSSSILRSRPGFMLGCSATAITATRAYFSGAKFVLVTDLGVAHEEKEKAVNIRLTDFRHGLGVRRSSRRVKNFMVNAKLVVF